jgi:ferredoxin-type protein NapG
MLLLGGNVSMYGMGANAPVETDDDLLRPPGGQDEKRFLALCVKCGRCLSACPMNCVTLVDVADGFVLARTPRLNLHAGYCNFCNRCIVACPTAALEAFDPLRENIGKAVIDEDGCIAYASGTCAKCKDSCAFNALSFDGANRPVIDWEKCNGCGRCVYVCRSNVYLSFGGSRLRAIEVKREAEG